MACNNCAEIASFVDTPEGDVVCTSCGSVNQDDCALTWIDTYGTQSLGFEDETTMDMPSSFVDALFPSSSTLRIGDAESRVMAPGSKYRLRKAHTYLTHHSDCDRAKATRKLITLCEQMQIDSKVTNAAVCAFWGALERVDLRGETRRSLFVVCLFYAYYEHHKSGLDWNDLCSVFGVSMSTVSSMERKHGVHIQSVSPPSPESDPWSARILPWCSKAAPFDFALRRDLLRNMHEVLHAVRDHPELHSTFPDAVVDAIGLVAWERTSRLGCPMVPSTAAINLARKIVKHLK